MLYTWFVLLVLLLLSEGELCLVLFVVSVQTVALSSKSLKSDIFVSLSFSISWLNLENDETMSSSSKVSTVALGAQKSSSCSQVSVSLQNSP